MPLKPHPTDPDKMVYVKREYNLAQPEHCSDCGQKLGDANHIHTCSPQPEQDGKCKYCTDGCPACDARKLPEQEPVAFINVEQRKLEWAKYVSWDTPTVVNLPKIPLYTTPPQRTWVGLTDEEIVLIVAECAASHQHTDIHFAKAIEAKLKEKNNG